MEYGLKTPKLVPTSQKSPYECPRRLTLRLLPSFFRGFTNGTRNKRQNSRVKRRTRGTVSHPLLKGRVVKGLEDL